MKIDSSADPYANLGADLRYAINPRSIAIVGASDNADKLGGRCLQYLKRFGFTGAILPINPTRDETQGVKTYPGFDALPEVAELVVIAVPGDAAVEAVEACARHGTRVAVILTAGFGETDDAGRANFSTMFVETTPVDGPIAIVSQSGGGSSVPFGLLRERGIGVRYCNAIGNQCRSTLEWAPTPGQVAGTRERLISARDGPTRTQ